MFTEDDQIPDTEPAPTFPSPIAPHEVPLLQRFAPEIARAGRDGTREHLAMIASAIMRALPEPSAAWRREIDVLFRDAEAEIDARSGRAA